MFSHLPSIKDAWNFSLIKAKYAVCLCLKLIRPWMWCFWCWWSFKEVPATQQISQPAGGFMAISICVDIFLLFSSYSSPTQWNVNAMLIKTDYWYFGLLCNKRILFLLHPMLLPPPTVRYVIFLVLSRVIWAIFSPDLQIVCSGEAATSPDNGIYGKCGWVVCLFVFLNQRQYVTHPSKAGWGEIEMLNHQHMSVHRGFW